VQAADPSKAVLNAMNFYIATRIDTSGLRSLTIRQIGIRNMERAMEAAVDLHDIDYVVAFGSLVVAALCLCAQRISANSNLVSLQLPRFFMRVKVRADFTTTIRSAFSSLAPCLGRLQPWQNKMSTPIVIRALLNESSRHNALSCVVFFTRS
jgi:hypothetical protein